MSRSPVSVSVAAIRAVERVVVEIPLHRTVFVPEVEPVSVSRA